MARYKFVCRSCKFECISGIGKVVDVHAVRVVLVCHSCLTIDDYVVPHKGTMNSELRGAPVCMSCHSSEHLKEWDGFTCPQCNMNMRALGGDVDTVKPFKYW